MPGRAVRWVVSDKADSVPAQPLGPREGHGDLSFMNYDSKYQGPVNSGSAAYWAEFCYQFTPNELRHLHGPDAAWWR